MSCNQFHSWGKRRKIRQCATKFTNMTRVTSAILCSATNGPVPDGGLGHSAAGVQRHAVYLFPLGVNGRGGMAIRGASQTTQGSSGATEMFR